MASYRILNGRVISRSEYLERLRSEPESALEKPRRDLAEETVADARLAEEPGAPARWAIGPGRPLTILIRHVYTGRYPDLGWRDKGKPMAIVSGTKTLAGKPAARGINWLEQNAVPRRNVPAPTVWTAGTNVVSYSPAVVTDQLQFTVEMAFDKFNERLIDTISRGLQAAGGIPLLMPAQGYLLAAGKILSVIGSWANGLIDGQANFVESDSVDFDMWDAQGPNAPEYRVLCADDKVRGLEYRAREGLFNADGSKYSGDHPYIVLSLDGKERPELKDFAPTVVSAELMKQFFDLRDGAEISVDALVSALKVANDLKFRQEAVELNERIKALPDGAEKSALQKRLEALLKNILSQDMKPNLQ